MLEEIRYYLNMSVDDDEDDYSVYICLEKGNSPDVLKISIQDTEQIMCQPLFGVTVMEDSILVASALQNGMFDIKRFALGPEAGMSVLDLTDEEKNSIILYSKHGQKYVLLPDESKSTCTLCTVINFTVYKLLTVGMKNGEFSLHMEGEFQPQ